MTEAGLTVHHCAQHDPLYRLRGVCVLAFPAESGTGHGGIAVSWTVHNLLLLDWDRYGIHTGTPVPGTLPAVIGMRGARHDNLRNVDADVPPWRTVAVAGVAPSGGGTDAPDGSGRHGERW